jgi:hypothetical protein
MMKEGWTYGCPASENLKTSTSIFMKALFSAGVRPDSLGYFSTTERETCCTWSSSFGLASLRNAFIDRKVET